MKRLLRITGLNRFAALHLLFPENRDNLCNNEKASKEINFRPRPLELS